MTRSRTSWLAALLAVAALALPTTAVAELPFSTAVRVAGDTPRDVAVETSRALFPDGGAGAVVLAREDDFPDALGASSLTSAVDGPLLLTPSDRLADATAAELDRVLPAGGKVYLLGGTAAISAEVEATLDDRGFVTPRFPGRDRVETAAMVARFVGAGDTGAVLLVRGFGDTQQGWVDSVSCGGWAADTSTPILLTRSDDATVHPETLATMAALGPRTVHVCGGAAAVPDAQVAQLRRSGLQVRRHAGADRAATAVAVARGLWGADDRAGRNFLLVRGDGANFGYGLVAAPLSAELDAPILLVRDAAPTDCDAPLDGATGCYLREGGPGAAALVAVGGQQVVPDDTLAAYARLADLVEDTTPPARPTDVVVTDVPEDDGTALQVAWTGDPEPGTEHVVYVRRAGDGGLTRAGATAVPTGEETSLRLDDLVAGAAYEVAVDSRDRFGNTTRLSRVVTATPTDEVPAPPATDVAPTVIAGDGALEVSWLVAPEADVDRYVVQRFDAGDPLLSSPTCAPALSNQFARWAEVATVDHPTTTYVDTAVVAGDAYCYRYLVADATNPPVGPSGASNPVVAP